VRVDRLNIDPALPVHATWTPGLAAEAVLLAALAIGAIASLRSRPALALGILWFFLWLAPTNSLLPRLDVANDRQLYLALVGPAWLAAGLLGRLSPRRASAVLVLLACALGLATIRRNETYASEIALWEDVVAKSPHSSRAFNNLGYAYALSCRKDDAAAAWRTAQVLDPGNFHPTVNLDLLRKEALPGVAAACSRSSVSPPAASPSRSPRDSPSSP
jgi:hypothetical protein